MLKCYIESVVDDAHIERAILNVDGKSGNQLEELKNWLLEQMMQPYEGNITWPENDEGTLSFKPTKCGPDITIHMVVDPARGILYSDGACTNGQRSMSREFAAWIIMTKGYMKSPTYNFIP